MPRTSVHRASVGALATAWAALGLAAVIAFGAYLRFVDTAPLAVDAWWQGVVAVNRGSAPYAVAVLLAEAGTVIGSAALTAVACALLLVRRRGRDAGAVATAVLLGVAGSELMKSLVLRPRPGGQLYAAYGSSYPSGHSMAAAALTVSLALVVSQTRSVPVRAARAAWLAAIAWTIVMMWSRTALQVHWLSDTVGGMLLGAAVAVLSRRLWFSARTSGPPGR